MTPTQPTPPAPPPGPPPAPPSGPPASPGATPTKRGGGSSKIWLILFIVAAVLFVGALVFAIISFTGKNSEADDKEKAEQELASTRRELEQTQEELGTQQGAGEVLGELVRTGEASANDLKACADSARELRSNIVAALNAVQAGTDINSLVDGINAQIDQNDSVCGTSDQSFQDFIDALEQVRN
jgi:flagellar basal body-associated protein FliL